MLKYDDIKKLDDAYVMQTYARMPALFVQGAGCSLWDNRGNEYLDLLAGIAVCQLGHCHPAVVSAITRQAQHGLLTNYCFPSEIRAELAEKLVSLLPPPLDKVFILTTGSETVEFAIKIARMHGLRTGGRGKNVIVSFEKAFHGRSIATLSATGNPKVQAGFEPLVEGFIRVPINDLDALRAATAGNPNVVAVFFEAIQGEGGVHPLSPEYMAGVRALCDEHDWLLMIDEVQCGMGRTGKWFAHQWAGIRPDVMPLAKGLGSGVPIGAVVAGPKAAHIFQPGNHGTTFGGNPLAMRAGLETIRIMEDEGLLDNAAKVGTHLHTQLWAALHGVPGVREIRGKGLMLGIELDRPCGDLVQRCARAGLLLSVTAERVIRLVPPLILTHAEADEIVAKLVPQVRAFLNETSA